MRSMRRQLASLRRKTSLVAGDLAQGRICRHPNVRAEPLVQRVPGATKNGRKCLRRRGLRRHSLDEAAGRKKRACCRMGEEVMVWWKWRETRCVERSVEGGRCVRMDSRSSGVDKTWVQADDIFSFLVFGLRIRYERLRVEYMEMGA
jgi:hypothetical protein